MKYYIVIALTMIGLSSCSIFKPNMPTIIARKDEFGQKDLKYYSSIDNKIVVAGTNNLIVRENGNSINLEYDVINKVLQTEKEIFLATKQGLMNYKFGGENKLQLVPTPTKFNNPQITDVIYSEIDKTIHISTNGYGCFKLVNGKLEQSYSTPVANCLAETADSSIWIGTNYGLVRLKNNEITRYSEEIVTQGFNVPDNIIEKLYVDPDNILWIVMSEAIAFATPSVYNSQSEHTEIHSFPFIGSKSNKINGIAKSKKGDDFWLFATDEGLFMLYGLDIAEEHHEHGMKDKLSSLEGDVKRFKFENNETKIRDIIALSNGDVQIITEKSVWLIPRNTLLDWRKE